MACVPCPGVGGSHLAGGVLRALHDGLHAVPEIQERLVGDRLGERGGGAESGYDLLTGALGGGEGLTHPIKVALPWVQKAYYLL